MEESLKLVVKHAQLSESLIAPGRMMAILESPKIFYEYKEKFRDCVVAAHNFKSHFVVSGLKEAVEELGLFLKSLDITFQILPIQFAFRSNYMNPIKEGVFIILDQSVIIQALVDFLR